MQFHFGGHESCDVVSIASIALIVSSLRILNFSGDIARRCAMTANQCGDSPKVIDVLLA